MNALAELGMVSVIPSSNQTLINRSENEERLDYFIHEDGETFAGRHLLVDLWDAQNLDEPDYIDRCLREAAIAAGATILHSHFHHFTPNGGVSGVVVLAESHISIHTWPERNFAALDIFMCGDAKPHRAAELLRKAFKSGRAEVKEERRGREG
jgi:S-adenosylmethionine decarboxylase